MLPRRRSLHGLTSDLLTYLLRELSGFSLGDRMRTGMGAHSALRITTESRSAMRKKRTGIGAHPPHAKLGPFERSCRPMSGVLNLEPPSRGGGPPFGAGGTVDSVISPLTVLAGGLTGASGADFDAERRFGREAALPDGAPALARLRGFDPSVEILRCASV